MQTISACFPMPRIEWRHQGKRLVIPIAVLPALSADNPQSMIRANGLIDTGATGTAIREDIAEALKLKATGKRQVFTANGDIMANEYLFRVGFYPGSFDDPTDVTDTSLPFVLDTAVPGFDLSRNFKFPVLIGMDVLTRGDLEIGRAGSAVWSLPTDC